MTPSTRRYVCLHGHFYQPPRENPWLEAVERQESAWPFHDWNERVHAECYGPNASARILDRDGRIERITNNYVSISFDFGPTLLAWMEEAQPAVYRAVIDADRQARVMREGHGSAMAQAYGHLILPLCNERDQRTQVRWGMRDFAYRFGRRARAMWLPEAAADTASLEAMAAEGVEITVLAPNQCKRIRRAPASGAPGPWIDTPHSSVDTRRAYRVRLPSGKSLTVFFYDGPLSRSVAFERLLDDGGRFARRLTQQLDGRDEPQLVHIATDGETYGHHHRFGEMALAFALRVLEEDEGVSLTTYEEFAALHPPEWEAQIEENSSWSCAHGVERWRSDCGCQTGGQPGWGQHWRAPLREALDWLRDQMIPLYESEAAKLLRDPWEARDGYIELVLDRSDATRDAFFAAHAARPLSDGERVRALELLEMQRHAMLMYTSCGWFFSDLGGIETIQIIQYAARALQLATHFGGDRFEAGFLSRLSMARSNRAEMGDGEEIYEEHVRPAMIDLRKVAAHFAVSSLFTEYGERVRLHGYEVDFISNEQRRAGRARLGVGRMHVTSRVTQRHEDLAFAVVHLGDHNLGGGVRVYEGPVTHNAMKSEIAEEFTRFDLTAVLRSLDRHFPESTYSLRSLFRDEQRRILDDVLGSTLETVERNFEQVYSAHAPLMRYLASLGQTVPKALHHAAEYTLTARVRRELSRGLAVDLVSIAVLAREARESGVTLQAVELGVAAAHAIDLHLRAVPDAPRDADILSRAAHLIALAGASQWPFDPVVPQNRYYALREALWPERAMERDAGDALAKSWCDSFVELGVRLGMRV